jgi:hypothetical protein
MRKHLEAIHGLIVESAKFLPGWSVNHLFAGLVPHKILEWKHTIRERIDG